MIKRKLVRLYKLIFNQEFILRLYSIFPFLLISMGEATKAAHKKIGPTEFGINFESIYCQPDLTDAEIRKFMLSPLYNIMDVDHINKKFINKEKIKTTCVAESFKIPTPIKCHILDYYAYLIARDCPIFGTNFKNNTHELIKSCTMHASYKSGLEYNPMGLLFSGDGRYLISKNCERIYDNIKIGRFNFYKYLWQFNGKLK